MSEFPEMRRRVERLLANQYDADDITRLFLFARENAEGRESVKEIGDFIAHPAKRNRGLITRTARDLYLILQHKIDYLDKALNLQELPSYFLEYLNACKKHIDENIIKKDTGLKKKEAEIILDNLMQKLDFQKKTNLHVHISQKELSVFKCYTRYIISTPVFSLNRLFADFVDVMRRKKCIHENEIRDILRVKTKIGLYALAAMLLSTIDILSDRKSQLFCRVERDGTLSIMIDHPIDYKKRRQTISMAMFITDILAVNYCSINLLRDINTEYYWNYSIELNRNGILDKM